MLNTDAIQSATSKLRASNVRRQVVAFLYMGIQMITDYKCSDVTLDFGNLNWHLFCTIFNRGTEISWSAGVLVLPIFPLVLCSCLLVLIGLSLIIYLLVVDWSPVVLVTTLHGHRFIHMITIDSFDRSYHTSGNFLEWGCPCFCWLRLFLHSLCFYLHVVLGLP